MLRVPSDAFDSLNGNIACFNTTTRENSFLAPVLSYGRLRRALRARKTLTPRFTDFFTDFEKKNRLFCSLYLAACSGFVLALY